MKKIIKVRLEDFDVEMLKQKAREGKLFIETSNEEYKREEVINNVRAYVARIKPLVTPPFRDHIDSIWEAIFQNTVLMPLLMPTGRAEFKEFDKYKVLRIIGVLHNKQVYEFRSDMEAFCMLESTRNKSDKYRRFLGAGLDKPYLKELRTIVSNFNIVVTAPTSYHPQIIPTFAPSI